jgi:glucose/arabinose dehydrogenase
MTLNVAIFLVRDTRYCGFQRHRSVKIGTSWKYATPWRETPAPHTLARVARSRQQRNLQSAPISGKPLNICASLHYDAVIREALLSKSVSPKPLLAHLHQRLRMKFSATSSVRWLRTCSLSVSLACAAWLVPLDSAFSAIKLKPVATGFSSPVDIANAGDTRLFIVEQAGRIKIINRGSTTYPTFLDISTRVLSGGERGLLGLAFAPDYATSGRFYVYYTRQTDGAIRVSRFNVKTTNPNEADDASESEVITIPRSRGNHNGGGLRFGADGMLYIATGDSGGGGDPDCVSQDQSSLLGKLLRVDVSGASGYVVPPNNPLGTNRASSAILAIGLRNPWRISFDRVNGSLFIGDVGQGEREEVNQLTAYNPPAPPAAPFNFGWPQREGTIAYSTSCVASGIPATEPILDYDRSAGSSITGGYRYRGTRVPELASGEQYTYGDFSSGNIWSATRGTGGAWTSRLILSAPPFTVSTFGEDSAGEVYVANYSGTINRITSTLGPSLDIDLNTSFDAATDGVLLLRYLLGFRGSALIANAIGSGAQRSSAQAIENHIGTTLASFNVDGNSGTLAMSDGLIALRFLLNFPDAALTPGTNASQTPALIRATLEDLKP